MIDLFTTYSGLHEEKLHYKFKLLRDNPAYAGAKKVLEKMTTGFHDRDNKIVKEFQTTFHSSLWEFFIYYILKETKCTFDFSKQYPDFIISNKNFNVECVVSEIKKDGDGENKRTLDDFFSMIEPFKDQDEFNKLIYEATTRHSNSINFKLKKYKDNYSKASWVNNRHPFVIALGSYDQIRYGKEFYYSMLLLLYGLKYDVLSGTFERVTDIPKPGTQSPIPVGLFNNEAYKDISAVIFSCTTTLGKLVSLAISSGMESTGYNSVLNIRHDSDDGTYKAHFVTKNIPEAPTDGLFILYNHLATNKFDRNILTGTSILNIGFIDGNLIVEGENSPIVGRLHMPSLMLEIERDSIIEKLLDLNNAGIKQNKNKIEFQDVKSKINAIKNILKVAHPKSVSTIFIETIKLYDFDVLEICKITNYSRKTVTRSIKILIDLNIINESKAHNKRYINIFSSLIQ